MALLFNIISIITIITTINVITNHKPIYALLYFLISLLAIAVIFFIIGAYFAGAMEIIIYAGAVMVLFVFFIMFLNSDMIEDFMIYKSKFLFKLFSIIGIIIFFVFKSFCKKNLIFVSKVINIKNIGIKLFGPYFLLVELASMLLLAGLIVTFHFSINNSKNFNFLEKSKKNID